MEPALTPLTGEGNKREERRERGTKLRTGGLGGGSETGEGTQRP